MTTLPPATDVPAASGNSPAKRTPQSELAEGGRKTKRQSSLLAHFAKIPRGRAEEEEEEEERGAVVNSSPVKRERTAATATVASSNSVDSGILSSVLPSEDSQERVNAALVGPSASSPAAKLVLSAEQERLLALELAEIPPSWLRHISDELTKPYFIRLREFLAEERHRGCKIFPPDPQVYSWAKLCPFEAVRVVIIGQDPYHNDGQAMGLCFSVPRGVVPPPSLLNIYKELSQDVPGFVPPRHGDLSHWAQQGVLLLNTSLTVRAHEPASHSGKGWEQFTDAVIKCINRDRKNVVFILWGNHAQKKAAMISTGRHHVLRGVHPSPLSAARGFFGCKHFSKANQYLIGKGLAPIDWQLPM